MLCRRRPVVIPEFVLNRCDICPRFRVSSSLHNGFSLHDLHSQGTVNILININSHSVLREKADI